MTSRTFIQTGVFILLFFAATPFLRAQGAAAGEKAKIEALISHLEGLDDAAFIRNGKEYDAKTAAKFLRGKWHAHEKEIKTAANFITIAATQSSTSGKPYLIRLKGGAQTPCADYLNAELKKLGAAGKDH